MHAGPSHAPVHWGSPPSTSSSSGLKVQVLEAVQRPVHGWLASAHGKVESRLPGKGVLKTPWHEAGPRNHLGDIVEPDQLVVNTGVPRL